MRLAGSPGPHVFVDSIDSPELAEVDRHHLTTVLRLGVGEALTISDGHGRWRSGRYEGGHTIEPMSAVIEVPAPPLPATVAFSLVKGNKPELVIQKLTELGIDRIVVLAAERSIVRWDAEKVTRQLERWHRIVREAAMQSHRVRLPAIDAVVAATDWLRQPDVSAAHFGGTSLAGFVAGDLPAGRGPSIAIGPEGGWSAAELEVVGSRTVSLGATVLRAETAAIAAGTLLSAMSAQYDSDPT